MEWEFRKILDSIESYRSGSQKFIFQIQKGTPGYVKPIVREIQLVINDTNSKILAKVLGMRFARDIMILGRQDVVTQLSKFVPQMLKIASYKIESSDPDRGQTIFHNHPQYLNASPQQKSDIDRYGSTYFTLTLESIYFWAKWVPADQYGNQSIFSKALNTLLERGVHFPNKYSYYKNSDTEKFKNTYRVQFFEEASQNFQESSMSHSRSSNFQNESQVIQLDSVQKIKNSLYLLETPSVRDQKLQDFRRNAINLLQKKYPASMVYYGEDKRNKAWLQKFIVSINLLADDKIKFNQFVKRNEVQSIQTPKQSQIQIDDNTFKKHKLSTKRQYPQDQQQSHAYQQLLKNQEQQHQDNKQKLKYEIRHLAEKLETQKNQHNQQKRRIIKQYEQRINFIKLDVANQISAKNNSLIKQNQKLKIKVSQIQKQGNESQSFNSETTNLAHAYEILKGQSQRERQNSNKIHNYNLELTEKIKQLQNQLINQQSFRKTEQFPNENILKNKQFVNLKQQLEIYKNSIKTQREQSNKKIKNFQQKIQQMQMQIQKLHQKNRQLKRKLDQRDIQAVEMNQQIKILMKKDDLANTRQKQSSNLQNQMPSIKNSKYTLLENGASRKYGNYFYKKYQGLRRQVFSSHKQRYLRFCRCALKQKDLLLKQQNLQVGLISEPVSDRQLKFIVHLTNTSQIQMNEIRINCQCASSSIQTNIQTQFIFCIMPGEQEKVIINCRSSQSLLNQHYEPVFLNIFMSKQNKQISVKAVLPFLLFKTLQMYPNRQSDRLTNPIQLKFGYSSKMISSTKQILTYFPKFKQSVPNLFCGQILHRESGTLLNLAINLQKDQEMGIQTGTRDLQPQGDAKALCQDILGLLQFCFRRT